MGQHKHNPTATAAKNGELPPKKKPMSKRERDDRIMSLIVSKIALDRIYANVGRRYTDEQRGDLNG